MYVDRLFVTEATRHWVTAQHLAQDHNYSLVVLAGMIATFVAFTTSHIIVRLQTAGSGRQRTAWLATSAITLGSGIWTTQFIGILALSTQPSTQLDGWLIAASVLASMLASGGAVQLLTRPKRSPNQSLLAGLVLGIGCIALQFLSIAAFAPRYAIHFEPLAVGFSLLGIPVLAIVIARSLYRAGNPGDKQVAVRIVGALVVGLALIAMHLLVVWSSYLVPSNREDAGAIVFNVDQIATTAAIMAMLINGAALIAAAMEHRVRATSDLAAQRLRLILDALPLGIAYMDTELCFRFANRSFLEFYHDRDAHIIGQSLLDVAPPDAVKHVVPFYRQALRGEHVEFTANTPLPGAGPVVRNILLVPEHDDTGDVRGVYVVTQDITQQHRAQHLLKESEQKLQSLLENIPAAVFLKDSQARYQLVNRQFQEWFGVDPVEIVGKTVHELYPPERAMRYWAGDQAILSSGKVTTDEVDIPTVDGELRTFVLTKYPITDHGVANGYGGIIVDMTERARSEQALRSSERRAELANRAKSEFLANMSHELRTPLNAILGFTEILKEEMLGPLGIGKYVEYATDIHSSAEHLLGLINDILDLSKIESGNDALLEEDICIREVVDAVMILVKGRAHDSRIEVLADLPDDLPTLCADKRKLKQILVNLLTNALKFSPSGSVVRVSARRSDDGGFELEVADTGIGMKAEDIPRALSPFGQLDSALSRRTEGTGLGLPLTSQLVELHGGYLEVFSTVGEGTTVVARFPSERVMDVVNAPETVLQVRTGTDS